MQSKPSSWRSNNKEKKGDKFHSYGISPDQLQSRLPIGTMELREAVVTCQCIIKGEFDLFQSDEGSSDTNTESRFPYRKPVRRVAEDRRLDRNEYGCRPQALTKQEKQQPIVSCSPTTTPKIDNNILSSPPSPPLETTSPWLRLLQPWIPALL